MSINKLRFWSQKVLPLVYDESLSYYEVLNKMRYKINEIITGLDIYQIKFADPIYWDITKQYEPYTIVKDEDGGSYISKQPVPAGIALTNMEYWQNIGETQVFDQFVVNVADYGVLGVEGADYSVQLTEALTHGNVFYFPSGTYSFKNVTINKPIMFFGEGEDTVLKPLHRIDTSNQYATMIQSTSDFTIANLKIVGDNSISEQTGEKFLQTAIIQQYGHKFRMTGCTIDEIYDTWHLGVGIQEFYERNGLLLYCSNCDRVEIDRCTVLNYGGEELTFISRNPNRFGDAVGIYIHDNLFKDRTVDMWGSTFNVLGGDVYYFNNTADNYMEKGSFTNLLGNNVNIYGNVITNSDMAGVFDTCEGYYVKSNSIHVYNNYQEDSNHVTENSLRCQGIYIDVHDNHFEATNPITTYAVSSLNDLSDTSPSLIYLADASRVAEYDTMDIKNNVLVITGVGASATMGNGAIRVNQNKRPAGSRPLLKNFYFENNKITKTDNVTTYYNLIISFAKHKLVCINNNYFPFAGTGVPSSARRIAISFAENIEQEYVIYLNDNVVDDSVNNIAFMFLGINVLDASYANIFAKGNTIRSGSTFKVICVSAIQNVIADYNLNFSASQG